MSDDPKTPLEQRSKVLFDESVEALPAHIRSRLTQARHRAVEQAPGSISRRIWLPAAGLTAAAVAAVVVIAPRVTNERSIPESFAAADDMAMLLNDDDLELIENMEFYAWMEDGMDATAAPNVGSDDAQT